MLEDVLVWHLGGWVLWWRTLGVVKNGPVDAFIDDVILGNKPPQAPGEYIYAAGVPQGEPVYTVTFRRCNRLELVFAAVHVRSLALPYVGALVEALESAFTRVYEGDIKPRLKTGILAGDYSKFDTTYDSLLARYEGGSSNEPKFSKVPQSKKKRAVAAVTESRRAAGVKERDYGTDGVVGVQESAVGERE